MQDGGTWLAGIRPRVIDGDVYLFTTHISSYVHQTVFIVDLSGPQLPSDWQRRLYWVEGESFPSPLNPFADRVHEIQRRRIHL